MKYIVDLDDTLVNTSELNNDAYNYALGKYGYPTINKNSRISRNDLAQLEQLDDIVKLKQRYFTSKWLAYRIIVNNNLLDKIMQKNTFDCYIWTKADRFRAQSIWQCCNFSQYYNNIIFDEKVNYRHSVSLLKNLVHDDMLIYENNAGFFENSKSIIVDTIINDNFHINGYFVMDK